MKVDLEPTETLYPFVLTEDQEHLRHRCGVRCASVDRLGEAGDIGDHVRVVYRVHRCGVAGVEGVVALAHEREQVCRPAGVLGRDGHEDSFWWLVNRQGTEGDLPPALSAVVTRIMTMPHAVDSNLSVK